MSDDGVSKLSALLQVLHERMDRLERTVTDRNDELHCILRDMAVQNSGNDHYHQKLNKLADAHDDMEDELEKLCSIVKNITAAFGVVRTVVGILIPTLLSIGAALWFKLDGLP